MHRQNIDGKCFISLRFREDDLVIEYDVSDCGVVFEYK